jgi:NAD(P)-dependent dehydrogenase (short-subunit alcohol dehydrogenase family)
MRIRFDGKTAVVSGAGHGFGRCIAETFAQLGARVFGCDLPRNLRKPRMRVSKQECWI